MTEELAPAEKSSAGISRRSIVQGAVWTVPVVGLALATPLAAASAAVPTDIAVTLQPTPPSPGSPLRLTYRGTAGFDFVPFPAGSTATVTVGGSFSGTSISGATITNQSGVDPVVYTLTITDPNSFYVQGTGQAGSYVSVVVYDGATEIGSDFTSIGDPV